MYSSVNGSTIFNATDSVWKRLKHSFECFNSFREQSLFLNDCDATREFKRFLSCLIHSIRSNLLPSRSQCKEEEHPSEYSSALPDQRLQKHNVHETRFLMSYPSRSSSFLQENWVWKKWRPQNVFFVLLSKKNDTSDIEGSKKETESCITLST